MTENRINFVGANDMCKRFTTRQKNEIYNINIIVRFFFTCSSWCWTFSRSLSRHPRLLIQTSKTLRLTQTTCRFWHLFSSPMTCLKKARGSFPLFHSFSDAFRSSVSVLASRCVFTMKWDSYRTYSNSQHCSASNLYQIS